MKKLIPLVSMIIVSVAAIAGNNTDSFDLKYAFGIPFGAEAVEKYSSGGHHFEKPFRGFDRYTIHESKMGRVCGISLVMGVNDYPYESCCDEVQKIKNIIENKYHIQLSKPSPDHSRMTRNNKENCFSFSNQNVKIELFIDGSKDSPNSIHLSIISLRQRNSDNAEFEKKRSMKGFSIPAGKDADML